MKYSVRLLPAVHDDLQKAKKWYHDINEELAKDFKQKVNQEIDYIANHPEQYQKKYKQLRQSLVTRFPYAIFYKVYKTKNQVVVFGVLHTSRDPELVKNRIKMS